MDDLADLQEFASLNSKRTSTIMDRHLMAVVDGYGLERLRLLCEVELCEDVTTNTVATTLALAEQHHYFQLKAVCLKFIASPRENMKGMGYLTACFAVMVGHVGRVVGVEHIPQPVASSIKNIESSAAAPLLKTGG